MQLEQDVGGESADDAKQIHSCKQAVGVAGDQLDASKVSKRIAAYKQCNPAGKSTLGQPRVATASPDSSIFGCICTPARAHARGGGGGQKHHSFESVARRRIRAFSVWLKVGHLHIVDI